jgi:hypothetical protein
MTSERRPVPAIIIAMLGCLLASACADFSRGSAAVPVDGGTDLGRDVAVSDGGALSFAATVHPLLIAGCRSCHASGQQAGDTRLLLTGDAAADYLVVAPLVDPSAPASSRLLSKMSGNGHGGGTVYAAGTPEYQAVLQWIQQGAPP